MSRSCDIPSRWITLGVLLVLAGAWPETTRAGSPESLQIAGAVSKPTEWTVAKLKETFAAQLKQLEYTIKGQKHVSTCVPLLAIVQAAEPVTDPKHKNFAMRLAVVVRAADGYAATFGMGELMPDVANHSAWIAIDVDGQPLSGREAPTKLIVPGDAKPARAVWGVRQIDVVDPTVVGQASDARGLPPLPEGEGGNARYIHLCARRADSMRRGAGASLVS
jgi:hypothetical protein